MNVLKSISLIIAGCIVTVASSFAQTDLTVVKKIVSTPVKNQASTGTCWSFSTTSLIESQTIRNGRGEFDLSEMFTARNVYVEKAKNYILRQGTAQFGPGGLGHDVIRAMAVYGAMPESVYSGLLLGEKSHDHNKLDTKLKSYLDSLLKVRPMPNDWLKGFQTILDDHLGSVPETFLFQEKQYTPFTFAKEVLQFNQDDYVNVTSFSHHPFYTPFILEVPDNFLNGFYYNLPLNDMIKLTEHAVELGFSVMWDADVSNTNFQQKNGFALMQKDPSKPIGSENEELVYDQEMRQQLFENLTTQDDHLMHIVGLEKSASGRKFFLVKNSWGEVGPFKGMLHVSEAYFAINTISLVIPKVAFDNALKSKLGIK